MSDDLNKLLEMARRVQMTPEQAEEQRRSFAYGNTKSKTIPSPGTA